MLLSDISKMHPYQNNKLMWLHAACFFHCDQCKVSENPADSIRQETAGFQLFSTLIITRHFSWAPNNTNDSECYTEDWSNAAVNSALQE